jgi:glycosyltransferase involved in cell wall biosynthesis
VTIRFSAAVVSRNEAHHLRDCLPRLAFCDEVVVVDLESSDGSAELAASLGARVVHRPRVPDVERLRPELLRLVRNDWVVLCDPDEIFPMGVGKALAEAIAAEPRLGVIGLPTRYHFRGRPLTFTEWGRRGPKRCVVHRERAVLPPFVHAPLEPAPGFVAADVGAGELEIEHRWVESLPAMFEKHGRYLRLEGEAMHARGERFSWRAAARASGGCLARDLFRHGGAAAGPTGWFLSAFHGGYTWLAWTSLRRFERRRTP